MIINVNEMPDGELKEALIRLFRKLNDEAKEKDPVSSTLYHMVEVAKKSLAIDRAFRSVGSNHSTYFEFFEHVSEAIYALVGEHTDTFCDSVTYHVLHDDKMTNEQCVDCLMVEYNKSRTKRIAYAGSI